MRSRLGWPLGNRACHGLLAAALLAASIGPSVGFAQTSAPSGVEQQVTAIDDEYVVAEVGHDEPAMRRLIDDRFVFNTGRGAMMGKEAFIAQALKLPMVGQTISERSVLVEGDMAFVFATTELRFAGAPGEAETVSTYRYTCAYVRREGQWRMLALQMQLRTGK